MNSSVNNDINGALYHHHEILRMNINLKHSLLVNGAMV